MRGLTVRHAAVWPAVALWSLVCFCGCGEPEKKPAGPTVRMPRPAPPPGMVLVEAGEFIMGSNDGPVDEQPQRTLFLPAFYMDKFKVTNSDYAEFMEATKRPAPPHWRDGKIPRGQERFPVFNVSWQEACAYAEWAKKRLPTEEEWEKAARGPAGRRYPWGSDFDATMHATDTKPREVGAIGANASPYECFDMVAYPPEWTSSVYTIPLSPKDDELPPGLYQLSVFFAGLTLYSDYPEQMRILESLGGAAGDMRVVKGGARSLRSAWSCTASYREAMDVRASMHNDPFRQQMGIGFRCAKSLPETK